MRRSRPLTVTAAAAALLVVASSPAAAHPGFTDGATAPAGSLTTLTLAMAHGCGAEDDEAGAPTVEIAIEVPDAFSHVEPQDVDGYEATTDGEEGAVPEVVTWTATDGGVPAPEVVLEAVVDGVPGDVVYVPVFQGCDGDAYRWVGTPDEPADDPAVVLTLTEPDPDAPPPAPEEPAIEPDDPAPTGTDDGTADDEVSAEDDTAEDGDPEATTVEDLPTEPPEDEGGGLGWIPIVLGAIVLAGLGGMLAMRRRPIADPAAGDGTGLAPPTDER